MSLSTIVLASGNRKKLKELSSILEESSLELIPQSEFGVVDAIEDGLSFVENAIIKARHACRITGMPAIADDSGIEVDYLKGAPGIYSARFAGEGATDEENLDKLLVELEGIDSDERKARYQCVIVFMRHPEDPTPLICQASWEGTILSEKRGTNGFGYDPVFFCPQSQKTAAQMTAEQKSTISHRGKALNSFQKMFNAHYMQQHSVDKAG